MVGFSGRALRRVFVLPERAHDILKPLVCTSKCVCRTRGSRSKNCTEHGDVSSHSPTARLLGTKTHVNGAFACHIDNSRSCSNFDATEKSSCDSALNIIAPRSSHWRSYLPRNTMGSSRQVWDQNVRSILSPLSGKSRAVAGLRCYSSLSMSSMSVQRERPSLGDKWELEGSSKIDSMQEHQPDMTTLADLEELKVEEDYDFRNFPDLQSSSYKDYELPNEMHGRKKRVTVTSMRKVPDRESKLTMDSIPQPKGRSYDFGLQDLPSKPPPLEVGAKPQGGFDFDLPSGKWEESPSEVPPSGHFPSVKITSGSSQAVNWSEVPEHDEGTL